MNSDNIYPVYKTSDLDSTKLAGMEKVIYIEAGADDQSLQEWLSSQYKLDAVNEEFHSVRLYFPLNK